MRSFSNLLMNKGFIFDWSGTLSDSFSSFYEICGLMFSELGGKLPSKEEIQINFAAPYMMFWNKYFPDLTKGKQDQLYKKYVARVNSPSLYNGVQDTLEYLHKAGYKIFILSSDWLLTLTPEVEKSGLKEFFTEIIGEAYDKRAPMRLLKENHCLDTSETFYVGDTEDDIEVGRTANIKTVGISWGFQHKSVLAEAEPDFLIDHISEVKNFFEK